jgi:hypothetical protein
MLTLTFSSRSFRTPTSRWRISRKSTDKN